MKSDSRENQMLEFNFIGEFNITREREEIQIVDGMQYTVESEKKSKLCKKEDFNQFILAQKELLTLFIYPYS